MRATDYDIDDQWSRLRRALERRSRELLAELGGGGCADIAEYKAYCAKLAMIAEIVELIGSVRRDDDLRPPPVREKLRSPED